MKEILRVLIIEDSEDDALLLLRELRKGGYDPRHERVDTAPSMTAALERQDWDIVIADYSMPLFSPFGALELLQERDLDLPFIILSGAIGEDVAVEAMRSGVHDYIMKSNMARLLPAIDRELQDAVVRRENRRAEEALRQSQKLESLGLLAGGIAHDFNNLLLAMLLQCSIAIAKLPENAPARDHIQKCVDAAESAADITRQMLAYAGRGEVELRPLSINDVVRDNLGFLKASVPKNVSLRAELGESLPMVWADPGQMQQVVMNLIINAAEAIGEVDGRVTVITRSCDGPVPKDILWSNYDQLSDCGRYVLLEVHDTGVGLNASVVSKIFDPFFTTKESGRGLGLAAVLGIVRTHKGGLSISSEPRHGTSFKLFFPAVIQELAIEPHAAGDTGVQANLILVIDDEAPVREGIADMMALNGVNVVSASSGSEGLKLYQEHMGEIDLVLLDLSMPGLSGEETLRRLRDIDQNVPVILSTGYGITDAARCLAANGRVGLLQKPYDVERLNETIQRHLETRSANQSTEPRQESHPLPSI